MSKKAYLRACLLGAIASIASAPASAREAVDLILYHGKVLTVDKAFSVKTAVAVRDKKIVAVGGDDLRKRFSAKQEIDLKGRTLMPGFTDTHLHPIVPTPSDIDVGNAHSIAEVQAMLRKKAAELGPGKWITGFGWQESNLAEKRNITRADLDPVTPDNPVLLIRNGGHSAVSNGLALKLGKVDRNTPDPATGLIEHDESGEPNGIIRERYEMVRSLVPKASWEEMRPQYVKWLRHIESLGITSFFNASGSIDDEPADKGGIAGWNGPDLTFNRARTLYGEMGELLPRMTMYITYPGEARLRAFPHHSGYGDEYVRLGAIGEGPSVDGGFTGPTAWLLADYKGQPGFRGAPHITGKELQDAMNVAAQLDWQVGVHCIGDAAIAEAVRAYDHALRTYPSKDRAQSDRRWFTDHFTILPPDATMETMKADHIALAAQPNFLYNLEDRYEKVLDDWRLTHNNPVATPAHKFGLFVALGSDNLPINPFVGLYSAVTRKGPSGRAHGLKEEGVSRAEAIRMYTANGPWLSWEEKTKGTLEPGKFADMIVLPFDPLTADPDKLLNGKVDMTFIGGKLVYDRAGKAS